jgi:hypothetical protein
VSLKRGQKLAVTATVSGHTDVSYTLKLQIYPPTREADVFGDSASGSFGGSDTNVALNVSGQTVGETGTVSDDYYQVSGTYCVSLGAQTTDTRFNPPQSTPDAVRRHRRGQPQPTATPAPPPDRRPAPQLAGARVRSGRGELGEAIVLALSLGGLLGFAAVRLGHLRP